MNERLTELVAKLIRLLEEEKRESEPIPWEAWMHDFLRDLERHRGVVSAAIDLNVKSRDTIYRARKRNKEFARRWEDIVDEAAEANRRRRAGGIPRELET